MAAVFSIPLCFCCGSYFVSWWNVEKKLQELVKQTG
jgi:hypothetical protein